ncbi:MAG: hypothetical protein V1895_01455 [Parcubacteria group bacterium]
MLRYANSEHENSGPSEHKTMDAAILVRDAVNRYKLRSVGSASHPVSQGAFSSDGIRQRLLPRYVACSLKLMAASDRMAHATLSLKYFNGGVHLCGHEKVSPEFQKLYFATVAIDGLNSFIDILEQAIERVYGVTDFKKLPEDVVGKINNIKESGPYKKINGYWNQNKHTGSDQIPQSAKLYRDKVTFKPLQRDIDVEVSDCESFVQLVADQVVPLMDNLPPKPKS